MADDALSATLDTLADANERARLIEAEIRTLAARAAIEGASYGDIGRSLRITRQGARKRFPCPFGPQHVTTTSVVDPAAKGASLSVGPPQPASAATTMVVVLEGEVENEDPAGGPPDERERAPAVRTDDAPAVAATTLVVAQDEPSADRADRPADACRTSRRLPATQGRPATYRGAPADVRDRPGHGHCLSHDQGHRIHPERIENGYRVVLDGVECGALRPDYTGTMQNQQHGWLPMPPGLVSVFPAGPQLPDPRQSRHASPCRPAPPGR
ncbi:hypothetical protein [Frankia sp. CiP3]|uniref:hypothetical protein n=1 Tax=Frankia sp. CiP3 TaxID=2880971 RepID=UPI001EF49937|nr:hypothetical protein [Frankia sp. CiP3]